MPTIATTVVIAAMVSQTGSPIEVAARRNNALFAIYIFLLVLIAVFTYLTWDSGNKLQDATRQDANARIQEAAKGVAGLQRDNLKLAQDLEGEKGKVAHLQAEAANAKAAQQQVEVALEQQKERTASAEKDLALLRQAMHDRHLSAEQRAQLITLLSGEPKGPITVETLLGDGEAIAFTNEIVDVFKSAGWTVDGPNQAVYSGPLPIGFGIIVHSATTAPRYAARIQQAFFTVGYPIGGAELPSSPEGKVRILIGRKPNPVVK